MKIGAGKVIGAAMFAAGVAAIWLWPKQKAEVSEDTVVRPVRSMVVTGKATLPELRCPGKVRAGESRDLMFEVPGRLVEFKLDRGQSVKKGDVLGKLDMRDYEADVAKAEAEFESKKLSYERYSKALGKGGTKELIAAMGDLRRTVDALEYLVDDSRWPLPKYREMLFVY